MKHVTKLVVLGLSIIAMCGCSGGMKPTVFLHPEYNFNFIERVAVIPFANLSDDQGAAARATRFFGGQLLAKEVFDIVEPGEVASVLGNYNVVRTDDLTEQQVIEIGKQLNVQALFLGSIGESAPLRSGSIVTSTVTITVRLVETETGQTVWSATHTEGGRGFWSYLFGTGEKPRSEVTRKAVETVIETLVE